MTPTVVDNLADTGADQTLLDIVWSLYLKISALQSLHPSDEVNSLFTELVAACIPPTPLVVSLLPAPAQDMRSNLIRLCAAAEGNLESHFSDLLASFPDPLRHLHLFPYLDNYIKLSRLEHDLLALHVPGPPPSKVAFIGSGPLPLTSIVLASRHLPSARFHNYDRCPAANSRAQKLVLSDPDLCHRMSFITDDIANVSLPLARYDVVFLAALVGMGKEEKMLVVEHLGRHMAPGAALVVRSAHGARAFLYPVVEPEELQPHFDVLAVHHPSDEVINSVIIARKPASSSSTSSHMHAYPPAMPCKCCEMRTMAIQLGARPDVDVPLEELPLS